MFTCEYALSVTGEEDNIYIVRSMHDKLLGRKSCGSVQQLV